MKSLTPLCPYCNKFSVLVTGKEIYPHRPDLSNKNFYQCKPCDAYVGCHQDTVKPLGTLANQETRQARKAAHYVFDQIWKDEFTKSLKSNPNSKKNDFRKSAYKRLSKYLGIDYKDCHIALFDVEQCKQVIEFSRSYSS